MATLAARAGEAAARGPGLRWAASPLAWLVLILVLAAVLRVAHLLHLRDLPMFQDPEVDALAYHESALAFAGGDWLLGDQPLRMSPGYQYGLGLIYAVLGSGPWPVRAVHLVLGLLAVVLVWDTARRLLGAAWAWLPALALAAFGPAIFYEGTRLATTAALAAQALLLWWVVALVVASETRLRHWALAGVLLGLCTLIRPNALLLGLPLALAASGVLAGWRNALSLAAAGRVAALALACALAIAPIGLRNWAATGHLIWLTDHGGQNLYIGNGPGANGTWRIPRGIQAKGIRDSYQGFHDAAERALGRELSPVEADRYWYRRSLRSMLDSPSRTLRLLAAKAHLFWNGYEFGNVYHYQFYRELSPVLSLPLVHFAWFSPLALVGTLIMVGASPAARVVAGINLTACLTIVLFFVLSRYRMPFAPGALIAATFTLQAGLRWWRRRQWLNATIAAAVLALGIAIAWPVSLDPHLEREYFKLGRAYHRQERQDEAEAAYERALAVSSGYLPARRHLAVLLEERGDLERAALAWRTVGRQALAAGNARLWALARARLAVLEARGVGRGEHGEITELPR